jgi:hypothetical protein
LRVVALKRTITKRENAMNRRDLQVKADALVDAIAHDLHTAVASAPHDDSDYHQLLAAVLPRLGQLKISLDAVHKNEPLPTITAKDMIEFLQTKPKDATISAEWFGTIKEAYYEASGYVQLIPSLGEAWHDTLEAAVTIVKQGDHAEEHAEWLRQAEKLLGDQ